MVLRNNNFIENNNCYETSILYKSEKNNNFNMIKESVQNYKELLSSYWTEINLIGYKIELLGKQKVEYPKEELKSRIIYIGSEIRGIIEGNKRNCFHCRFTITKKWYRYLNEHYLCNPCHDYKISSGKMRPEDDRKCFICGVTQSVYWRRHSEIGNYLCNGCGCKQRRKVLKKIKP
uniref:GATA-type domain-containing protein n=1 Tax=Meloidogyne incognita TaxID=6306 RepID=A0A914MRX5_MELIC